MPHAVSVASPGLQALILCGPGHSLETFTSSSEGTPKALLPVANRPMVWYPLDWCHRMGITTVHLVSTPVSSKALETALSQNPHLTSLPLPRATVLVPPNITQNSGTVELLRAAEVQAVIKGDFLVLPCDLVSEIPGEDFLEAWMIQQPGLSSEPISFNDDPPSSLAASQQHQRHGGLGVWYQTRGDSATRGEETDFLITAPLSHSLTLITSEEKKTQRNLATLALSTTTATLKDIMGDDGSLPIRHAVLRTYSRIKTFRAYRDAHIYVFPYWILDIVNHNTEMDSISEDLVGSWAKAGWQEGLASKLGFHATTTDTEGRSRESIAMNVLDCEKTSLPLSVHAARIPPILAYTYAAGANGPLLRRADTSATILQISLQLAKLEAVEDSGHEAPSPLAHPRKIASPASVASKCTVTKADCLLADNVTVEEKCVVKESVLGANCHVKSGARLTRCVVMDGVTVGERCQLTGCILGRRSQVGRECVLKDCEVQDGIQVEDHTDSKGEHFTFFEALEGSEGFREALSEDDTSGKDPDSGIAV